MENQPENRESLIASFCEITSATREEAAFFLDSHQWELDAAVSTFLDDVGSPADTAAAALPPPSFSRRGNDALSLSPSLSPTNSADYAPSESDRSRSRSPSPPPRRSYGLRSGRAAGKNRNKPSGSRTSTRRATGNIRTLNDLNRSKDLGSDSDSDEQQEFYTGGEKSGMLVQDPRKVKDVDALFDKARQVAVERPSEGSSSRFQSFTGTGRLLSGETVSSAPEQQRRRQSENVVHVITFWRNGFTVNDGPLRRMDDPANASFLESTSKSECPKELEPTDSRVQVHVDLVRRCEEDYVEPPKPRASFQGVGRTLGGSTEATPAPSGPTMAGSTSLHAAPRPTPGIVVDDSLPKTSLQLRLADGTRMVSRFNYHHTIRDVRAFVDAARPGTCSNYQLIMGFPPKQLTDLEQTIEQAGIANSVVIQKY